MVIQTEAFLLGSTSLHSNKSGKDFNKISFVIDGDFCAFFVPANVGATMMKSKHFAELAKTGAPQKCCATIELKFTDKGVFTDLRNIE